MLQLYVGFNARIAEGGRGREDAVAANVQLHWVVGEVVPSVR